jgi:alkylation response protein AidB-like acyl-CoA dehydrogenase
VFEQIGRTLAATPLLSSVVLGGGLLLARRAARRSASGGCRAWRRARRCSRWRWRNRRATTRRAWHCAPSATAARWRLDGTKQFVLDGHVAERLVVVARSAGAPGDTDGPEPVSWSTRAPGIAVERTWMVDSRNAARIRVRRRTWATMRRLGSAGRGLRALDRVLDRARLPRGRTAGRHRRGLRAHRGLPEGARAVRRADRLVPGAAAPRRAAVRRDRAAEELRGRRAEAWMLAIRRRARLVSLAKARASDLSEKALNEAVQMHGGIGVTDEFDIGLFLKRARVLQQTFGDGAFHRDRYARLRASDRQPRRHRR